MHRRELVALLAAVGGSRARMLAASQADPTAGWRVNGDRVNTWLTELSVFGRNPEGGVSRVGFTDADLEGRAHVRALMEAAGLDVAVDPAGNLIGRLAGSTPGALPLLFGSHIDSVPRGGNYDGTVGSLAAIEVIRTLRERGYRNRHPLWVTVWCDEESGLTGSRGFIGQLSAQELARPYREGRTLAECIARIGGAPERLEGYRYAAGSIAGYLELHIEQGGNLERDGAQIGVVEGIVGIRSWDVTITGEANHAGTTPMDQRRNALLAASELILAVDRIVRAEPGRQVGTVGRLGVEPGAQNVVPGRVTHSIELRDLSMDRLERLWRTIEAEAEQIMQRRGTRWAAVERAINRGAAAAPALRSTVDAAARGLGLSTRSMPSMAGHDAQSLAAIGPMGMIFVPSVGGISHSPREFTRPEDVTNGVNVLLHAVLRLDRAA